MEGITINFKVAKKEKIILQISSLLDTNNIYNLNEIKQVKNGRNSKVFIAISGDKKYIIKKYHYHLNDLRNRLDSEFRFLTYLNDYSIDNMMSYMETLSKFNQGDKAEVSVLRDTKIVILNIEF